MKRLVKLVGYQQIYPDGRIYKSIIEGSWVTERLLFSDYTPEKFIDHTGFWRTYYGIGKWYLHNIRKLMYGVELITFSAAVYLVNTGTLLEGILIGVLGILLANRLSETRISIKAEKISSAKVDEYEEEKRWERRRQITR